MDTKNIKFLLRRIHGNFTWPLEPVRCTILNARKIVNCEDTMKGKKGTHQVVIRELWKNMKLPRYFYPNPERHQPGLTVPETERFPHATSFTQLTNNQ